MKKLIIISLKITLVTVLVIVPECFLKANNLSINNVELNGQNTTSHFTKIRFDISWENSWRVTSGPSNWDATWVFAKYRLKSQTTWNHATLNWVDGTGSNDGHTVPSGATISSSNDNGSGGAKGVFIYHSSAFSQSSVSYNSVKLRWNYGVDGLSDGDSVEICIFGIEMVYIPQGSFYVGSGGSEYNAIYEYPTTSNPYQITSENAITVGTSSSNLYYAADNGYAGDQSGPIPASFPKGYQAFYCMKYEISQSQYVSFLNKLDNTQATTRAYTSGGYRNGISGSPGNYTSSNPYVSCNYLSWGDVVAYLDWAGLRPMTELEYEKVGRGTQASVAGEYSWGNTTISGATSISNSGLTNEIPGNSGANCIYNFASGVQGPMRVGCCAQSGTTRQQAGAGYYGNLDLSGSVLEHVVTVGHTSGRSFTGVNGDGVLNSSGDADVSGWPTSSGAGAGFRGGSYYHAASHSRLSDRSQAVYTSNSRYDSSGGRGVRLAP